jgi:hypothetical protein
VVNSRQKGKRGELDLCHSLKAVMGWRARRSQQFCGDSGDSDVVTEEHPNLFIECKLVQALNLTAVMKLAVEQAKEKLPAVFHRRDREEWLVTVRLTDLPRLVQMLTCETSPSLTTPSSEDT